MLLPLANPKRTAKTTSPGILPSTFNQMPSTETRDKTTVAIMVLYLPSLSQIWPGSQRPKNEPALRIARSWYEKVEETLEARA